MHTAIYKIHEQQEFIAQELQGFPAGSDIKESVCNAGDLGSIPGLGRSSVEGMATHSSILVWRITWTEEPGRVQSMRSQRVRPELSDFHTHKNCIQYFVINYNGKE